MSETFIKDSKFFFTGFHSGTVNILLHIISFIVLGWGLVNQNLVWSLLGYAFFDEIGHAYNYFILHKKNPYWNPLRMLPYQAIYTLPVALLLFKVFGVI